VKSLSLLAFLLLPVVAFACDQGFTAFQNTVYQKVRRDCALCHDGTRKGAPPFATADAEASYNQILTYMNFANLDESLLVVRAGNGHCGVVNCQAPSGAEMLDLVSQWYDGGEKTCQRNGVYFSTEIMIPADLPSKDQGFATLSFDLGSVKPELAGLSLQLEAQNYLDKSGTLTRGAYRFRSPRIVGGAQSIYVKDLKVLLNGKYDVIYDNYTVVDRVVPFFAIKDQVKSSTPVLSSANVVILKDSLPTQKLGISFVEVDLRSNQASCPNSSVFQAQVQPAFKTLNCASCHKSDGASVGEKVLDMTAPEDQTCATAAALVDPVYFMTSPLIQVPSQGFMNHPQLTDAQRADYVRILRSWLNR
jgi:hypothetical protein